MMFLAVSHLVAVHEEAQHVDLVDEGLDGGPAADAEAEDKVVDHQQAVEEEHGAPASSPAVNTRHIEQLKLFLITTRLPLAHPRRHLKVQARFN